MKNTKVHTPVFKELLKSFLQELKKEGKDEIHVSQREERLKEFFAFLESQGIRSIKEITQAVADSYVKYLEEERKNENFGGTLWQTTINSHKSAIHRFWKYLSVEAVPSHNIWIRYGKKTRLKEITVLTHKEIQWLYSVCDETDLGYRDKAMLAIYYGCGLRKGEGQRLLLSDVDFKRGRILVRKSKNNRERYVMLSPSVQKQLEDYVYNYRDLYLEEISAHVNPDVFFIGVNGVPLTDKVLASRLRKLWKKVKEEYGTEKHISLHSLRHTLGTHLYMAKMDIEMIALMLGHRSLSATQVYIHLTNLLLNGKV